MRYSGVGLAVVALALFGVVACGDADEDDGQCEPEKGSEWQVELSPSGGNCSQEIANAFAGDFGVIDYTGEDFVCGNNVTSSSSPIEDTNCTIYMDIAILVESGRISGNGADLEVACSDGSGCTHSYDVDVSRVGGGGGGGGGIGL
jgi:hypothetical protein